MKRVAVLILFVALPICAARWLLVDFGKSEATTTFGTQFPTWNQVIRHASLTSYTDCGGDPDSTHWGLTAAADAPDTAIYYGVSGSAPISFIKGHKIVVTFYNSSEEERGLQARVSLTDTNEPAGATTAAPWYTLNIEGGTIAVGEGYYLVPGHTAHEMIFNIADASMIMSANQPVSVGEHSVINVGLYGYSYNDLVITKIELTDEADTLPPLAPTNLLATMVSTSLEAGNNIVELTWAPSEDQPGTGGYSSGIDRYFIYRNDTLYDVVNKIWTRYYGQNLRYRDFGAVQGGTYTYGVSAVDKALIGYYRAMGNPEKNRGNVGPAASVSINVPVFSSDSLINPAARLAYMGGFTLPLGSNWSWAGEGLSYYPGGNPDYDSTTELPGSLYGIGHDDSLHIAEINIPIPVNTTNAEQMPRARELKPFTDIWPRVYPGGNWIHEGEINRCGIAYHPGVKGVGEGIYYGVYKQYCGEESAPVHGWFNLDLTESIGAWHVGGAVGDPNRLSFIFTAKFISRLPQEWANTHTGGRSLLYGLGWELSGVGYPACGPALYAVAPWEGGSLPANGGVVGATQLLRYPGVEGEFLGDSVIDNWTPGTYSRDVEYVRAGTNTALVFCGQRPYGDDWYGSELGDADDIFADVPDATTGGPRGKGIHATRTRALLTFYNPRDLERVIAGQMQPFEPQPYYVLDIQNHFLRKDVRFVGDNCIAFDEARGYLYVLEKNGELIGTDEQSMVHVWRITSDSLAVIDNNVINGKRYPEIRCIAPPNARRVEFNFSPSLRSNGRSVSVRILNVRGAAVTEFSHENTGYVQRLFWDRTNSNGKPVAAGIYIVLVQAAGIRLSKEFLLVD